MLRRPALVLACAVLAACGGHAPDAETPDARQVDAPPAAPRPPKTEEAARAREGAGAEARRRQRSGEREEQLRRAVEGMADSASAATP